MSVPVVSVMLLGAGVEPDEITSYFDAKLRLISDKRTKVSLSNRDVLIYWLINLACMGVWV